MELALYCPICGYYEKEEDIIGRRGDYYTNVSVGKLFGELLAFQFAEWLDQCREARGGGGGPDALIAASAGGEGLRIVEAGAHGGALAADILGWMREHRPGLFPSLEYWIVEPSERRRGWQRRRLGAFGRQVHWVTDVADVAGTPMVAAGVPRLAGIRGIIFCNELLDAMPTHRLGWDAKAQAWFEWGVALEGGQFVWTRLAMPAPRGNDRSVPLPFAPTQWPGAIADELREVLPDGFTTEWCPAADQWWRTAANALACGKLLTLDYGLAAEEFFVPERRGGTLRAYQRHHSTPDLLANPGEQDLTAHVNFTAVKAAGESAGLSTDGLVTQAQFLTGIAARVWQEGGAFGDWTAAQRRQFQTLVHPDHLGRAFRVLVQSRGGEPENSD